MYKNRSILAIIPARGGSKGLPGKNLRELCGKPLLAWSIGQAEKSKYIDDIIVSSDDDRIINVAKRYGARVPFKRPKYLATDKASGINVILQALAWLEEHGELFDMVVVLQPTSPLRAAKDIDQAIELLFKARAQAVVSLCPAEHNPLWMNTLPESGCMKAFLPKQALANRQKLPQFYRLNGAIYIISGAYLKKCRTFYGDKTYAYIMPIERSVDIDTLLDFNFAEFLMGKKDLKHD